MAVQMQRVFDNNGDDRRFTDGLPHALLEPSNVVAPLIGIYVHGVSQSNLTGHPTYDYPANGIPIGSHLYGYGAIWWSYGGSQQSSSKSQPAG